MEPFTVYSEEFGLSLPFCAYQGTAFDNEKAMGVRMSLLFIEEGSGIARINEHAFPYIAPCVFCINEMEHIVIPEENHCKVKVVLLHPAIINGFLNYENIRNLPENVYYTVVQDREMLRFFLRRDKNFIGKFGLASMSAKKISMLMDAMYNNVNEQKAPNWPCRSRSYLMEILFLLDNIFYSEYLKKETCVENLNEEFYPILLYIYNNYDKKISVNELTEQFHMSKSTIAKRFQENVGESFLVYLNKLRINMAATMLRDTKLPVNEIMYRVGFSDNVHFFRTFKKYINESPTIYRENYNWM